MKFKQRAGRFMSALLLVTGSALAAEDAKHPDIGLALGSGGAGGLAHIAMLEVFEALLIEPSVIDADGFFDFVGEHMPAREFADQAIPLKVGATDYWSGESVIITEGDLFQALKASMAVPGLFSPVEDGDRLLHFDRVDDIVKQARPAAQELRRPLREAGSAVAEAASRPDKVDSEPKEDSSDE